MSIEQLIERLSQDVPRVSRHAIAQRIATGIVSGSLIAAMLVSMTLGIRPDLDLAMCGFTFWMKLTYTSSLAIVSMIAVMRLARPGLTPQRTLWLLGAPALALACICLSELASHPPDLWLAMWLGRSWKSCPWLVLILSAPIFVGLLWSFRRFAPTRLRMTGATAGLSAGAWAASIYCLHCPEVSPLFVLTWYTLGIVFAAGIGALIGPRLLRW